MADITILFGDKEFSRSLPKVLKFEGGKDNDPNDPGGKTNQGITQREYSVYRRNKGLEPGDVFNMTPPERDEIYYKSYWLAIKADEMAPGVGFWMFTKGVNTGNAQAVKFLQRALGPLYKGRVDGDIGTQTLDAISRHPDHDKLIANMAAQAEAFYRALKTFKHFGNGWLSRNGQEEEIAQAWAMGSVGPEVVYAPNAQKKAKLEDAKPAPSTAIADVTSGVTGTGTIVGLTEAINTAKDTIAPMAHDGNWVSTIFIGLVLTSATITAGAVGYRIYAKNRAAERAQALALSPVAVS